MHQKRSALPLLVALGLLAGCGSDATGPRQDIQGVQFSFTAPASSGTFTAHGLPTGGAGTPSQSSWAVGAWGSSSRDVAVLAFHAHTPPIGTLFYLVAQNVPTARPTIAIGGGTEADISLLLEMNIETEDWESGHICQMSTGTLTITEISVNRARGTFSGQGECVSEQGSPTGPFTVTNGTFNVPVLFDADNF